MENNDEDRAWGDFFRWLERAAEGERKRKAGEAVILADDTNPARECDRKVSHLSPLYHKVQVEASREGERDE